MHHADQRLSTGLRFSYVLPLTLDDVLAVDEIQISFMSYSLLVVSRPFSPVCTRARHRIDRLFVHRLLLPERESHDR